MARKLPPPDQGWSWVVVAGMTASAFIIGGFFKAFGIFFAAFLEKFDASVSSASMIQGTRAAVYMIVGPLATVMCDRYSERTVLITSCLLLFLGCIVASFAPNMEVVILATGALMGAGLSCFFGPVQMAIGRYFDKRKSIAISLAFSGICIAQVAMPPVNIALLETYSLHGTMLIYSGLMLNLAVFAALVRPRKMLPQSGVREAIEVDGTASEFGSMYIIRSVENIAGKQQELQIVNNGKILQDDTKLDAENETTKTIVHDDENPQACSEESRMETVQIEKNINYPHKLNGHVQKPTKTCNNVPVQCIKSISNVLDFSLCKNASFSLYSLALAIAITPFSNVPIYIFPRAEECGLSPDDAALLLTIMGSTDILARILLGLLGDVKRIGPKLLFVIGITGYGFSIAALPFTSNFTGMAIVSSSMGLFGSSAIVLNMPILVDMIGLDKLGKGVAMTSFITGIFNTVAPPFLGYIKDVTTSYDYVFFICGGMSLFGCLLMLVVPLCRRLGRSRPRVVAQGAA